MRLCCLLLLLALIASCSDKKETEAPFDSFVFSLSALRTDFSIKVDGSDTIYFQKRDVRSGNAKNYYAIAQQSDRDSLIMVAAKIDFTKYSNKYFEENLIDGTQLRFYKKIRNKENIIDIYGNNGPKELYTIALQFNEFSKRFEFKPINQNIDFGNLEHIDRLHPSVANTIK